MELIIASRQTGNYKVQTEAYEGPLDLLLQLIERAELSIATVSLAKVTDQYLAHIKAMSVPPDEISAFLVIAAKLLQIKSEALLPRPPERHHGEEDPAHELARQLQLYKRFKEIAFWLESRERQHLHTYLRVAPPPKIEGKLDLSNITLRDLLAAAESILAREAEKQALGTVITPPKITIREKITHIADALSKAPHGHFKELFKDKPSRLEVVVTFLALLELIKRYRVAAKQAALFGEIEFERLEEWKTDEDMELEFE